MVGVTAAVRDHVRYGAWDERAALVPDAYLAMVAEAGAVPVVLAQVPGMAPAAAAGLLAARVDGVVLTGGVDVDPARYDQEAHAETQAPDPARDAFETALLERAVADGLPVLAVCRGVQVLNVARGGTLHQHLPELVGHAGHMPVVGCYARHAVRVAPGTRLAAALGVETSDVPTHHHQGIDRVGRGLVPSAWAEDGVVEAVEDPDAEFVVGVQWHPEAGEDRSLFEAFVGAVRRARPRR